MTKKICDRCGREITTRKLLNKRGKIYDYVFSTEFTRYGPTHRKYELCYECNIALRAFMRNEPVIENPYIDMPIEEDDHEED